MILFSATRSFLVYTDRPKNINDVENKVDEGSEKTSAKTTSSTMGWDLFGGSKINGSSHFLKESNNKGPRTLFKNISIFCANNISANKNQNSVHFFLLNYQNVILDGIQLKFLNGTFQNEFLWTKGGVETMQKFHSLGKNRNPSSNTISPPLCLVTTIPRQVLNQSVLTSILKRSMVNNQWKVLTIVSTFIQEVKGTK